MSEYPRITIAAGDPVEWGRVWAPLGVGRAVSSGNRAVLHRLSATAVGVGHGLARFFAAGQLGSADAFERARSTGARC